MVLAAAFGVPAEAHNPRGMTAKIGKFLDVPVGARYTKKRNQGGNQDRFRPFQTISSRPFQTVSDRFES